MVEEIQTTLIRTLEDIKLIDEKGNEYWKARDLAPILGYNKWENFSKVIEKAKDSCKNSKQPVENHFLEVRKMVKLGSGSEREIKEFVLTRFACYLIAQNGDSKKQEIAVSQMYFAVQTRKQEIIGGYIKQLERIGARKKLTETEKKFVEIVWQRGVDSKGIAEIRSAGDMGLFNHTTQQMKNRFHVKQNKALADHLPTVLVKNHRSIDRWHERSSYFITSAVVLDTCGYHPHLSTHQ